MLFSTIFQEGPAHTTNYMVAGYIVIFGVMAIYLVSLYIRQRNLKQDMQLMDDLKEE